MRAAISLPTMGTIPEPCSTISATRTSSTPSDTPSFHPTGSAISGEISVDWRPSPAPRVGTGTVCISNELGCACSRCDPPVGGTFGFWEVIHRGGLAAQGPPHRQAPDPCCCGLIHFIRGRSGSVPSLVRRCAAAPPCRRGLRPVRGCAHSSDQAPASSRARRSTGYRRQRTSAEAGNMVEHAFDYMRLNADVAHAGGDAAANVMEPPIPDAALRERAGPPGRGDFCFGDFTHAPSPENLPKNGFCPKKGWRF
jgi:hypothetical protein